MERELITRQRNRIHWTSGFTLEGSAYLIEKRNRSKGPNPDAADDDNGGDEEQRGTDSTKGDIWKLRILMCNSTLRVRIVSCGTWFSLAICLLLIFL
jgi:hypothetical protein